VRRDREASDRGSALDSGQASVELLAILPALVVCVLLAAHSVSAGWALWSAGNAARAGARAEHVGSDGEAVARRALPGLLRERAETRDRDAVRVRVRAPSLLPGADPVPVAAESRLDPGDE
jgi:pilus assembly protein CpaE